MSTKADAPAPKRSYNTPELVVYGSVQALTQKTGTLQDQNQGGNNMYWSGGM